MCDFISWKVTADGQVLFLTDEDVFSSFGRQSLKGTKDNDILGHGAIDAYYGEKAKLLKHYENKDFWHKVLFPEEIARHLESPQTLLNTWGKMLKQALQPDDAHYILLAAPDPWMSAIADILVKAVSRDAEYSYRTLCDVEILTDEHERILEKAAGIR